MFTREKSAQERDIRIIELFDDYENASDVNFTNLERKIAHFVSYYNEKFTSKKTDFIGSHSDVQMSSPFVLTTDYLSKIVSLYTQFEAKINDVNLLRYRQKLNMLNPQAFNVLQRLEAELTKNGINVIPLRSDSECEFLLSKLEAEFSDNQKDKIAKQTDKQIGILCRQYIVSTLICATRQLVINAEIVQCIAARQALNLLLEEGDNEIDEDELQSEYEAAYSVLIAYIASVVNCSAKVAHTSISADNVEDSVKILERFSNCVSDNSDIALSFFVFCNSRPRQVFSPSISVTTNSSDDYYFAKQLETIVAKSMCLNRSLNRIVAKAAKANA